MLVVFNIPVCDCQKEVVTDVTDKKHVGSRNEYVARGKTRDKSDENIFLL